MRNNFCWHCQSILINVKNNIMNQNKEIPQHVVVIPDGNRRWAQDKGLEPWAGHDAGAKIIEEIVQKARDIEIKYLSFWGSSVENMQKRPIKERHALVNVYEKYFEKLMSSEDIFENQVQINVFGHWREQLPKNLVQIIEGGVEKTKDHQRFFLNFFLSYSGDEEMLQAVRDIANSTVRNDDITKDTIKEHLLTKDLPPVDYLIRTGGEPHLSAGFMMWDIANAQLFFSERYFPDFDADEFGIAIDEYSQRVRRLGA